MNKPVIGITTRMIVTPNSTFAGMERQSVNRHYVDAVLKAGGVPVLLPVITDKTAIGRQIEMVDGLLLSGGEDVDPDFYQQEPVDKLDFISRERDHHELAAILAADTLQKPIFGVCRGIQILNVAFGGTLYQDVSQIPGWYVKHSQQTRIDALCHTVETVDGTLMQRILGDKWRVNSLHHQAVKDVATGFTVSAWAKDGIIEAIEKDGESFVVGVQWHPELTAAVDDKMLALFAQFIAAAVKQRP